MKKQHRWLRKMLWGIVLMFFYFPILYMLVFSFNSSRSLTSFDAFSWHWYRKMFSDRNMMEAIYYTLVTASIATFIATIIGTITAIGLSKSKQFVRDIVQQINDLPIMNPEIVTAVGLMLFYVSLHIEKGFLTLLLAHIAFCTPYVILSIMPKLRNLDPNLAEAALDLGAKPTLAMRKIIVPQILPGIISGALIAFTMSFDDFTISYFVSGNGIKNISTLVWTMSKRINPSINALSTIIVLMITITLIFVNVLPMIKERTKKKNQPKKQKGFIILGACFLLVIFSSLFLLKGGVKRTNNDSRFARYAGETLKVYNWGEYMDPQSNQAFEKKYDVKIIYDTYDSNELMYTKLQGGESYDVLVPSDFMIERLIREDRLQPLQKKQIPNISKLASGVQHLQYDPNNTYSVPYFWGSVGIIYNSLKVDPVAVNTKGYSIFNDPKYAGKLYLYDSERDAFMMALKALGYSMNTKDPQELTQAYEWLKTVIKKMNVEIVTDEVIDAMVNGNKDLALIYSGDAAYIISQNKDMRYLEPKQGTNIWSDGMVIPKNAKNPSLANVYINFMTSYQMSYQNSKFVGYTSANAEALTALSKKGAVFYNNNAYLPRTKYPNDEIFIYNEEVKKIMAQYWTKVKITK